MKGTLDAPLKRNGLVKVRPSIAGEGNRRKKAGQAARMDGVTMLEEVYNKQEGEVRKGI
jgi:hypothetical protein